MCGWAERRVDGRLRAPHARGRRPLYPAWRRPPMAHRSAPADSAAAAERLWVAGAVQRLGAECAGGAAPGALFRAGLCGDVCRGPVQCRAPGALVAPGLSARGLNAAGGGAVRRGSQGRSALARPGRVALSTLRDHETGRAYERRLVPRQGPAAALAEERRGLPAHHRHALCADSWPAGSGHLTADCRIGFVRHLYVRNRLALDGRRGAGGRVLAVAGLAVCA